MARFVPSSWNQVKAYDVVTFNVEAVPTAKPRIRRMVLTSRPQQYGDAHGVEYGIAMLIGHHVTKSGARNRAYRSHRDDCVSARIGRVISVERPDYRVARDIAAVWDEAHAEHLTRFADRVDALVAGVDALADDIASVDTWVDPEDGFGSMFFAADGSLVNPEASAVEAATVEVERPQPNMPCLAMVGDKRYSGGLRAATGHDHLTATGPECNDAWPAAEVAQEHYIPTAEERAIEARERALADLPPTPVCINSHQHGPHRIAGTFRDHCPGYTPPCPNGHTAPKTDGGTCSGCEQSSSEPIRTAKRFSDMTHGELRTLVSQVDYPSGGTWVALAGLAEVAESAGKVVQPERVDEDADDLALLRKLVRQSGGTVREISDALTALDRMAGR